MSRNERVSCEIIFMMKTMKVMYVIKIWMKMNISV